MACEADVTARRYIFTVTAGRSGQASLTDLIRRSVKGVSAAFEEPQIRPVLPGFLGDVERRLRRRWVETHEILGRGDVLRAFTEADENALRRYAEDRIAWIDGYRGGAPIYFDVSKYFIRGLHRQLVALTGRPRIVFLVRDPILNMKSFVNRGKDFLLDNNSPEQLCNELPIAETLSAGEKYFWAWTEGYLRGVRLVEEAGLEKPIVIWTRELSDSAAMSRHFESLNLPLDRVTPEAAINSNESQGYGRTIVTADDISLFNRWRNRVPASVWARLPFMTGYDPALSAKETRPN